MCRRIFWIRDAYQETTPTVAAFLPGMPKMPRCWRWPAWSMCSRRTLWFGIGVGAFFLPEVSLAS
jgi:hypothetical protein